MKKRQLVLVALAILVTATGLLEAQRRRGGSWGEDEPNLPYDGRYTFVRVQYEVGFTRGDPPWRHDYPRGETHFTKLLDELSTVRTRRYGSNILQLSDPEIFKHPVLYMSEPGYWRPNDVEVENLRNYLLKGGFMFFDDFPGEHFYGFVTQLQRVLPRAELVELPLNHPIFNSFFKIESLDFAHPYYGGKAYFHGVFEDNDPSKRLLMIINTNNDLSEYWEFSDEGFFPVDQSNEAYKLGINYIVFALTR